MGDLGTNQQVRIRERRRIAVGFLEEVGNWAESEGGENKVRKIGVCLEFLRTRGISAEINKRGRRLLLSLGFLRK